MLIVDKMSSNNKINICSTREISYKSNKQNHNSSDGLCSSSYSNKNIKFKGMYFPSGYYTDEEIRLAKKYLHVKNFEHILGDEIWKTGFSGWDRFWTTNNTLKRLNDKINEVKKLMKDMQNEILEKDKKAKQLEQDLENKQIEAEKIHKKQLALEQNIKLEGLNGKKRKIELEKKKIELDEENLKFEKELIFEQKFSKFTNVLKTKFIDLAIIERNAKKENLNTNNSSKIIFPNGIMLTGLDSKDSNKLIQWTSKKADCNLKKIDFTNITIDEALTEIENIAKKSQTSDKRTLIHIENFEKFTKPIEDNQNIIGKLKAFLSSCSEKYRCTVISDVKNPNELTTEIIADHRFQIKINTDEIIN